MELEKINDPVQLTKEDPRMENYAVCLKMIFHDLAALNNEEVDKILKHYKVAISQSDRISITLPRLIQE